MITEIYSTSLYREAAQELVLSKPVDVIGNHGLRPLLLGDAAYPQPFG